MTASLLAAEPFGAAGVQSVDEDFLTLLVRSDEFLVTLSGGGGDTSFSELLLLLPSGGKLHSVLIALRLLELPRQFTNPGHRPHWRNCGANLKLTQCDPAMSPCVSNATLLSAFAFGARIDSVRPIAALNRCGGPHLFGRDWRPGDRVWPPPPPVPYGSLAQNPRKNFVKFLKKLQWGEGDEREEYCGDCILLLV